MNMNSEPILIWNLTEAYEKNPRETLTALWEEFRRENKQWDIPKFAQYVHSHYPEIAEKISTTAEKEFVRWWKNVWEGRKFHGKVSRIRESWVGRREFLMQSTATAVSSCLKFSFFTGPSLIERLLAQKMAFFAISEKIWLVPHREDPSSLLSKTILLRRMNTGLTEGFEHLFLNQVDEKKHGIFLGEIPNYENLEGAMEYYKFLGVRNYFNDQANPVINTTTRKLQDYFDTYSLDHADIMRKLPVDIIHEIGDVWYTAASNHSKYPDWTEIMQKSAKRALQYRADEEPKIMEGQLKSIDEMEGHYHGRAILEEWIQKTNSKTKIDYKKHLEKERAERLRDLWRKWKTIVAEVIDELVQLEGRFFPKKGKIIIP